MGSTQQTPSGAPDLLPVDVLVIDDDQDARELLASVIARAGYSVVEAENGRDALELLGAVRPEVIFLDICMPIVDGPRFRQEQRRNRDWIRIPTVVMTGANEEMQLDPAVEQTLRKPIHAHDVLGIVRRHCEPHPT
ncbi:MAG TPA: response regulator [Kofleriaceae bacterium]|nr:response regulator [Kofleriaceae bacterium]